MIVEMEAVDLSNEPLVTITLSPGRQGDEFKGQSCAWSVLTTRAKAIRNNDFNVTLQAD
jgi:hypothetical protein